jgi:hypothetical protein
MTFKKIETIIKNSGGNIDLVQSLSSSYKMLSLRGYLKSMNKYLKTEVNDTSLTLFFTNKITVKELFLKNGDFIVCSSIDSSFGEYYDNPKALIEISSDLNSGDRYYHSFTDEERQSSPQAILSNFPFQEITKKKALKLLKEDPLDYCAMPEKLRDDKEVFFTAFDTIKNRRGRFSPLMKHTTENFRNDKNLIIEMLKIDQDALSYASKELQNDLDLLLAYYDSYVVSLHSASNKNNHLRSPLPSNYFELVPITLNFTQKLIILMLHKCEPLKDCSIVNGYQFETVVEEIKRMTNKGINLDLEYYVDSKFTKKQQEELNNILKNNANVSLKDLKKIIGEDSNKDDVELLKIYFSQREIS